MKVRFTDGGALGAKIVLPPGSRSGALIVMPYTREEEARRCANLLASRAGVDGLILCVRDDAREGFIALANRAFRLSSSPFFGYVAQDAFPGRGWLANALLALKTRDKGLFAFNDGKWMGALASFGVASRGWAEENYCGDLFFRGYRSHYADVELSLLAMNEGTYCYDPNAVLVEIDWHKDGAAVDPADRTLYRARRGHGFNGRVTEPQLLEMFA